MLSLGLSLGLQDSGSDAALWLNFLGTETLDSRITFSRGSNATLTDSTGKITYAPANLRTYSEQFDQWTQDGVSVSTDVAVAPNGTSTADLVTATAGNKRIYKVTTTTSGVTYCESIYVKKSVGSTITFDWINISNSSANFNFDTGVLTVSSPWTSGVATNVGNGWYRIALFGVANTSSASIDVKFTSVGDACYLWGAQLEPVTYQTTPSTYQATTSSAYYGPRFDYDPVTLAAKGLLIEEARTNLLTYSADITNAAWSKNNTTTTADATTAPDGTTTADKLAETATTAVHNAGQSITTAAQAYTFYCYVKAAERNFALIYHTQTNASVAVNLTTGATGTASGSVAPTSSSVTSVGNGWWRVAMTVTATAASNFFGVYVMNDLVNASYAGTAGSGIYVWGAQLEAGSFATSYIPTVASTVTRSADVATMTGTNFSSWYNQSEGTFVAAGDYEINANWRRFLTADDTAAPGNNRIIVNGDQNQQLLVTNGGVTQASLNAGTAPAANIVTKIASAYVLNNFAAVRDGGTAATGISGTVPVVNRLAIGYHPNGGEYLNGHIRSIAYYNTRLPNSALVSLTA